MFLWFFQPLQHHFSLEKSVQMIPAEDRSGDQHGWTGWADWHACDETWTPCIKHSCLLLLSLIDWLLDWLVDWLVGWLLAWLIDLIDLIGWLVGWLVDGLVACLLGWLVGLLVGWLIDWLVDWLTVIIFTFSLLSLSSSSSGYIDYCV